LWNIGCRIREECPGRIGVVLRSDHKRNGGCYWFENRLEIYCSGCGWFDGVVCRDYFGWVDRGRGGSG
jgi:hypothetical protein